MATFYGQRRAPGYAFQRIVVESDAGLLKLYTCDGHLYDVTFEDGKYEQNEYVVEDPEVIPLLKSMVGDAGDASDAYLNLYTEEPGDRDRLDQVRRHLLSAKLVPEINAMWMTGEEGTPVCITYNDPPIKIEVSKDDTTENAAAIPIRQMPDDPAIKTEA
jgi:hypothetical protein